MSILDRIQQITARVDRAAWQEVLQRIFEDNQDDILGIYEGARERGCTPRVARRQATQGFFEAVAEDLAASLDEHIDWRRVENWELRTWLEQRDGPVFEALLEGALELIAWRVGRRHKRRRRFAGLLAGVTASIEAAGPIPAAVDDEDAPVEDDGPITVIDKRPPEQASAGVLLGTPVGPVVDLFDAPDEDEGDAGSSAARARQTLRTVVGQDKRQARLSGQRPVPTDLPIAPPPRPGSLPTLPASELP